MAKTRHIAAGKNLKVPLSTLYPKAINTPATETCRVRRRMASIQYPIFFMAQKYKKIAITAISAIIAILL